MEPFVRLTGVVAPMDLVNVDTDQIIPAVYLKRIERTGFGPFLFARWRFNEDGTPNPNFVLNVPEYRNATILVTGPNFGCGSSREHAPWALLDFGISCVIASSFADIFYNNCFKNGILPITLPEEDVDNLLNAADAGSNATFTVDLEAQRITDPEGTIFEFKIDPFRKYCLFNGLDDIGLTLEKAEKIEIFEQNCTVQNPWL